MVTVLGAPKMALMAMDCGITATIIDVVTIPLGPFPQLPESDKSQLSIWDQPLHQVIME
jgi:hypothetical protein